MEAFCNTHNTSSYGSELIHIKEIFTYAQIIFCLIGVFGNILNLRTLQSPSLQTVPFMYIRAMAVFDLVALSLIMFHFYAEGWNENLFIMFYVTYIAPPVINTFLVSGLYCAFFLTVERYLLISRPHIKSVCNPKPLARMKISMMLFFSGCIHLPMVLQRTLKKNDDGSFSVTNNVGILCSEPYWTIYNYYKLGRECLRFFFVILMSILNVIITRQLQITKQRRRRLVRRSSVQYDSSPSEPNNETSRREHSNLMKSFTEKKLTALMFSICLIFIFGNIPQMIVMVLQNEAMENEYGFQIYRYCSNLLEVVNHCLNFYVFCMASTDYSRAFLLNCICLRNILLRFPSIARFLAARRSSSVLVTSSAGLVMANKEFVSLDSIRAEVVHRVHETAHHADPNIRSILVTGNRSEHRQKKSLTIINHLNSTSDELEDKMEQL